MYLFRLMLLHPTQLEICKFIYAQKKITQYSGWTRSRVSESRETNFAIKTNLRFLAGGP